MRIVIDIETDNAAFSDDREAEILRIISEHFSNGGLYAARALRDYNGNRVGRVTIEDDDDEPEPHDARPTVDFHE